MNQLDDLIIFCRTTCGCGGKLVPYTKQTETTHYLLTCEPFSSGRYNHPLLIAIDKKSPIFEKANYRDVMIQYPWFQEIVKKGSDWYNKTKEKSEKWDIFNTSWGKQPQGIIDNKIKQEQEIKQLKFNVDVLRVSINEWALSHTKLNKENKQLREDNKKKEIALLDMIQQMRWDELAKHRILKIDDSLKQKTEKIKELIANINVSECESTTIDIINEISTILK